MPRPLTLLFCLVACAALSRPAAGVPARYIVFTLDENGAPRPQSHRLVDLPDEFFAERPAALAGRPAGRSGGERLRVQLEDAAGKRIFEDLAEVPRFIRSEHGLHGEEGAGELVPAQRSFVVRLPLVEGSRLRLSPAGGTLGEAAAGAAAPAVAAEFELEALAADAGLPLAGLVPATELVPAAGSPANRLDVLIMGDGYTAAEESDFQSDAAHMVANFFGRTPYAEYRSYVNTATLFTPSPQSGADHPPYNAACSSGLFQPCCADTRMQEDPLAGRFVATAFDATYCANNAHRLLVVDAAKVLTAAGAFASWDRILVQVNDDTYGGSGGNPVGVFSTEDRVIDLAQHEFGHSFATLADEYTTAYPGFPACSDVTPFGSRCESNVTDQTQRNQIKWGDLILGSTPIPTGGGDASVVGLFEGARYLTSGMYRPQNDCLMNHLGVDFCKVCIRALILALYQGGWGSPADGIDPIDSENPRAGQLSLALPGSIAFSAGLLQPSGQTVAGEWLVDGEPAGTGSSFTFTPGQAGTYRIELQAHDTAPLLFLDGGATGIVSSRSWTVQVTGQVVVAPTITAVAPDSGPATGGTPVTITGTNFKAGAIVKFGDNEATGVVVASANSLTCTTPPGAVGPVAVKVTTDGGSATRENAYTYGSTEPCVPGANTLCLNQNRFKVEVAWRTGAPAEGPGVATAIPGGTNDSGLFWFFSPNNQEMLLKVLDGCHLNERFWVFYAATTNVEFTVVVTDTQTGRVKTYRNALGTPAPPVQDIGAFAVCPAP
jgi:hypothetical protein